MLQERLILILIHKKLTFNNNKLESLIDIYGKNNSNSKLKLDVMKDSHPLLIYD